MNTASKFPDEESGHLPKKPRVTPPLSRRQRGLAKIWSLILGAGVWMTIKGHLEQQRYSRTANIQNLASEQWAPVVVTKQVTTVVDKILAGEKPVTETQTTVVNPAGVEPAVKVVTATETILANKDGKATEVIPHDSINTPTTTPSDLKDAQPVIDKALENVEKEKLPEEKIAPPIPPKKN